MNPYKVKTIGDLETILRDHDLEPTDSSTTTGRFWKCKKTSKHIQIPTDLDGHYPDVVIKEILEEIAELRK